MVTHTATLKSILKTHRDVLFLKNKYVDFPSLREMIQWPQIRAAIGVCAQRSFVSAGSHLPYLVGVYSSWRERRFSVKWLKSKLCPGEAIRMVLHVMTKVLF